MHGPSGHPSRSRIRSSLPRTVRRRLGVRWRPALVALAGIVVLASACEVGVGVDIEVAENGSGTVSVGASLDRAAAEVLGDLAGQISLEDLAAAGWDVSGPAREADNRVWLRASKAFGSAEQLPAVLEEIAGPGVFSGFQLRRRAEFAEQTWEVAGQVDPAAAIPELLDTLAFNSGLQERIRRAVAEAGGESLTDGLTVRLSIDLPGELRSGGDVYTWAGLTGDSAPSTVQVAAKAENTTAKTLRLVGLAAAALFVLAVLLNLLGWWYIRRYRKRNTKALLATAGGEAVPTVTGGGAVFDDAHGGDEGSTAAGAAADVGAYDEFWGEAPAGAYGGKPADPAARGAFTPPDAGATPLGAYPEDDDLAGLSDAEYDDLSSLDLSDAAATPADWTASQASTPGEPEAAQPEPAEADARAQPEPAEADARAQPEPAEADARAQPELAGGAEAAQPEPAEADARAQPELAGGAEAAQPEPAEADARAQPELAGGAEAAQPEPAEADARAQPELAGAQPATLDQPASQPPAWEASEATLPEPAEGAEPESPAPGPPEEAAAADHADEQVEEPATAPQETADELFTEPGTEELATSPQETADEFADEPGAEPPEPTGRPLDEPAAAPPEPGDDVSYESVAEIAAAPPAPTGRPARTLQLVVIGAWGVLFQPADPVDELLIPFVHRAGSTATADDIREAHRLATLARLSTDKLWEACGLPGEPTWSHGPYAGQMTVSAGAADFIRMWLRRGVGVACVTNDVSEWSWRLRQWTGFEVVTPWVISSDIGIRKPDPGMFEMLRRATDVAFANCLVIDCDRRTLDAARSLGMSTALYGTSPAGQPTTETSHPAVGDFTTLLRRG